MPSYWLAANAILPVVITVLATLALIITTGNRALAKDASLDATWINAFGNGNSYLALVYGSLLGLLAAIALPLAQRLLTWKEVQRSAAAGATHVIPALAILWLSWALSDVTRTDLKAGEYLGSLLKSNFQAAWLPTIVFVMASFVSFSTGTSWGTMSVLTPLVIESAYALLHQDGSPVSPQHPLLLATVGSVLSGAIFGDHCSPISDTTVLSSQASGCDHLAHVTTQMPYALATGAIAIVCGTIPVGFGVPVWWLLPLGVVALYLTMRLAGKKVESPQ